MPSDHVYFDISPQIIIFSYPSPKSCDLTILVPMFKFSKLIKHISLEYSVKSFILSSLFFLIFFSMPMISTMRKKTKRWLRVRVRLGEGAEVAKGEGKFGVDEDRGKKVR